jgi:GNAT superfamily N-acetyltransferase
VLKARAGIVFPGAAWATQEFCARIDEFTERNMTRVIAITNGRHDIIAADWLARAEQVHRQLRPHLPQDYAGRMREIFGVVAGMAVAANGDSVAGVTIFRVIEKTHSGRELYCNDLVTGETQRSTGVGHALIGYMEKVDRERGCDVLALDSETQRQQAHKFYFREGFTIPSFHYDKKLK